MFFVSLPVLYDFNSGLCDFTDFLFLPLFLHVLWVLTHKIVRFYELKYDFTS